jgi:pilus assembly protein Flp/PilA
MDIKTLYVRLLAQFDRLKEENGQDLVEYALIVALIAFAAIVGMGDLANGINTAFNQISQTLNTYHGPATP